MAFSKAQTEAISHKDGPMLVLAGPGAGKTLVITERTRYLIEQHGIAPSDILVVTFTKAAAAEMKERFKKLMGDVYAPVTFGTFHSIFFHILRQAYGYRAENIIREEQRSRYLRELIDRQELEIDDEQDFMNGIVAEISMVKTNRIDVEHYYSANCPEEVFKDIYRGYEEKLRAARLIDFDDMLVFCYELFQERTDILRLWQNKFPYIMVDEGQDINGIQYEVVKMLAGSRQNLFVVGDDDQSIYRFRGARPEILLNFSKDFSRAKMVLLSLNYRCGREIVYRAGLVIKHNTKRYEKKIEASKQTGFPVDVRTFDKLSDENEAVILQVQNYAKEGMPYSDMAVLYRTNIDPRALIEKCLEYNIPVRIKDSLPNIYEHWIVRNIISYIKIAMGSRERREFLQIANRPNRYISRECLDHSLISFDQMRAFYQKDKQWMMERIDKLEHDITMLAGMTPFTAIHFIRKAVGYDEYLEEYAKFRRLNPQELLDVLDELEESAKKYSNYDAWFLHMQEYKEELQQQAQRQQDQIQGVSFATMHSSKGLEYEVVFIVDANEGITPHKKAFTDADIEEERRLFYVGMTRAKTYLHIFSVKEKYNKKLETSRFVGELLLDRAQLQPGAAVYHKKYKEGQVRAVEKGKVRVYFEKPQKELLLDINACAANQILTIK